MGQKSQYNALFFPTFHNKACSHAHILLKNIYTLKNTLSIYIYIMSKMPLVSNAQCSLVIFVFKLFMTAMSISGQSNVNSVKITLYYGPKKSVRCLFFRFFTKKLMLSCLYFIQNHLFSKKHTALMPIFYQ